ncbi:GDSL-type esterase/lipase family protein [Balneolaceae bacterium ANBcel3]|nr:GDSL-type esterase/lipase family protein [Balneolaceae bacterium ANBcel3]
MLTCKPAFLMVFLSLALASCSSESEITLFPLSQEATPVLMHDGAASAVEGDQASLDHHIQMEITDQNQMELQWNETWNTGFRLEYDTPLDLSSFLPKGGIVLEYATTNFDQGGMNVDIVLNERTSRRISLTDTVYYRWLKDKDAGKAEQQWHEIELPFSCFIRDGDDLSSVNVPFQLDVGGSATASIRSIRLEKELSPPDCVGYRNVALAPAPLNEHWARSWWMDRHREKLDDPKRTDARIVFIGDSITQGWEGEGKETWDRFYLKRDAFNVGFSGDRTENVLWRLEQGQVEGMDPELAVLMIGTNNSGHRQDPPSSVARGIETILDELKVRLPNTKVLLLAVFPHGKEPDHEMRVLNNAINEHISAYSEREKVYFLDINDVFLDEAGYLPAEIMPDYLHPNAYGYELWAEAMEQKIRELLEE